MEPIQPTTNVVVIEEKKRRKGLLWVAGGAALALAIGGGTFALWSDAFDFSGGDVVAGDLQLDGCEDTNWYDISPDRSDTTDLLVTGFDLADSAALGGGINAAAAAMDASEAAYPAALTAYLGEEDAVKAHAISEIDTWRMVPGDTVAAICDNATIALEGDNMVASLFLVGPDGGFVALGDNVDNGVVVSAETFLNGTPVTPGVDGSLGYFGAPNNGQAAGIAAEGSGVAELAPVSEDASRGEGTLSVLFLIHFIDDGLDAKDYEASGTDNPSDTEQSRYLATETLAKVASGKLTLKQVRDNGVGQFVVVAAEEEPEP
ncbi:MAG: hypothetical protein LBB54_03200 [Cellulomonadaceae bacterium]|jgi:predicted ribosomally synthesized peptide with SipW-like signal peptide|nr:hypothetical protein [Cellulomonadaceae bacterium]